MGKKDEKPNMQMLNGGRMGGVNEKPLISNDNKKLNGDPNTLDELKQVDPEWYEENVPEYLNEEKAKATAKEAKKNRGPLLWSLAKWGAVGLIFGLAGVMTPLIGLVMLALFVFVNRNEIPSVRKDLINKLLSLTGNREQEKANVLMKYYDQRREKRATQVKNNLNSKVNNKVNDQIKIDEQKVIEEASKVKLTNDYNKHLAYRSVRDKVDRNSFGQQDYSNILQRLDRSLETLKSALDVRLSQMSSKRDALGEKGPNEIEKKAYNQILEEYNKMVGLYDALKSSNSQDINEVGLQLAVLSDRADKLAGHVLNANQVGNFSVKESGIIAECNKLRDQIQDLIDEIESMREDRQNGSQLIGDDNNTLEESQIIVDDNTIEEKTKELTNLKNKLANLQKSQKELAMIRTNVRARYEQERKEWQKQKVRDAYKQQRQEKREALSFKKTFSSSK